MASSGSSSASMKSFQSGDKRQGQQEDAKNIMHTCKVTVSQPEARVTGAGYAKPAIPDLAGIFPSGVPFAEGLHRAEHFPQVRPTRPGKPGPIIHATHEPRG